MTVPTLSLWGLCGWHLSVGLLTEAHFLNVQKTIRAFTRKKAVMGERKSLGHLLLQLCFEQASMESRIHCLDLVDKPHQKWE